jgi:hypothetical protein
MSKQSTLSLIPLIGDEQKFREAISPFVMPEPWGHKLEGRKCFKCQGIIPLEFDLPIPTNAIEPCPIPDPFSGSLAELYFGLRDKVIRQAKEKGYQFWDKAKVEVFGHYGEKFANEATIYQHVAAALYALEAGKGKER